MRDRKRVIATAILMLLALAILFVVSGVARAESPARQITFSGLANAPGAYGSYWRTEFSVSNGSESVITVRIADPQSGSGVGLFIADVQPGETYATADLIGDLGFSGAYAGMIQLFASPAEDATKVSVSLRTYTVNEQGGSYGVVLPSLSPLALLGSKEIALLGSPNLRRTFYFYMWKWAPFTATGYDSAGHVVWGIGPNELATYSAGDAGSVSPSLHGIPLPNNTQRVSITAAGRPSPDSGFALVYVTQADNLTNAPAFLP